MRNAAALATLILLLAPGIAGAQVTVEEPSFEDSVFRARVLEVHAVKERVVTATRSVETVQDLSVEIIEGPRSGEHVQVENSSGVLLEPGDAFYLHRIDAPEGELWSVGEPDRRWVLFALAAAFVLVTVLVAGKSGALAVLSLLGSFAIIVFGLAPALLAGASPVLTCVALATLILVFSMFVTHGINRPTFVALLGGIATLAVSAVIAEAAVELAKLSGFVSDEVVYLNFASRGTLDLSGLLLGGILIGIVGVLNDISVSQVHTVAEIHEANPSLSRKEVLMRAMRVGKEHVGAVVNTLPLAYAGSALPLIMLFSVSASPFLYIVNREVFAAEAIRIFAGGIALSLSGAIATLLAVLLLIRKDVRS